MLHIAYLALAAVLCFTTSSAAAPLCQTPLDSKTMYGSAEGSAQVPFLCDGDVVHEAAADDDLQLYLFPTDDSGLPDHNRSFGAFGWRFSGLIAWNQNSRGFFHYCGICDGQTDRQAGSQTYNMGEKFTYYHIVAKGETLASIAEIYLGTGGAQHVGALLNANPRLKALDQQISLESRIHPWGRVMTDWNQDHSDVPANAVLNISDVLLDK